MRRSPSSALVLVIACGPPHVFHKDPEKGCADVTLAGQEDVAATAGCSTVDSLTIRTGMALDLKPLARLATIRGALAIGPSVGLSEISLPRLHTAGSIKIVGNGDLQGIYLPALERSGPLEVAGNNLLTSLSLPRLTTAGALAITENPTLELIELSSLTTAGEIQLARNPKLTILEGSLPALQAARPVPASDPTPIRSSEPTP